MENLLKPQFHPLKFDLVDESSQHAGHAGARPGGETHYRLSMVAAEFAGLSRVARQRLVYQMLAGEFRAGLHALSLDLKAPGE